MRKLLNENYSDKEALKISESKWKNFWPGQKQIYLQVADNYKRKLEKDKQKLERDKQKEIEKKNCWKKQKKLMTLKRF